MLRKVYHKIVLKLISEALQNLSFPTPVGHKAEKSVERGEKQSVQYGTDYSDARQLH